MALPDTLQALPRTNENFGLIHFDFELDNIIWRDDRPIAIDFDDCAHYWYAADVAFALRTLFNDDANKVARDNPKLRLFVAGYRAVRDLPDAELVNLPLFLRFHHIVTLAKIRRALTPPQPNEPGPLRDLRLRVTANNNTRREIVVAWLRTQQMM